MYYVWLYHTNLLQEKKSENIVMLITSNKTMHVYSKQINIDIYLIIELKAATGACSC